MRTLDIGLVPALWQYAGDCKQQIVIITQVHLSLKALVSVFKLA